MSSPAKELLSSKNISAQAELAGGKIWLIMLNLHAVNG
jgi:hypothetical protein